MSNWREALDLLEIAHTGAAGPAGAAGDWFQLTAAFGTRGFLRALTDGEVLALECAPPGDAMAARAALAAAGWHVEGAEAPFVATQAFPDEADALRVVWVCILKLADATRAEDAPAFLEALVARPPAAIDDGPREAASAPSSSAAAFESIGESERPAMTGPFAFAVAKAQDAVEVTLGFSEVLERASYDELERRLIGNLRGKYDVTVAIVGAHEVGATLDVDPRTRVALRVRPDGSALSLAEVERAVGSYFETLAGLASSGIDPLVFLGARASKRATGGFEAIGAVKKSSAPEDEPTHSVLVADDDEVGPAPEEEDAVVFAGATVLDDDAPLQAGLFEDQRLKRSDATSALVDVVLRHPGYSDRSMGQVMSILLSLDYSSCLEISARAPTVVAWGVARDRALTMKTVIEGAGGKVLLVEPGTFGEV